MKCFLIYRGNEMYNSLPDTIKNTKGSIFKKSLKKYIEISYHPFDWNDDSNSSDDEWDIYNI